jgi:hypothetical protein
MPLAPQRSRRTARFLAAASLMSCAEPTGVKDDVTSNPVRSRPASAAGNTRVTIDGPRFRINGAVTYAGSPAAGMLMNVRMVNAVFEDTERPGFNPEANTTEFVNRMDDYVALGVRGFTVSLQGGFPGYEGARNTAFRKNGDLDADYLKRVERVIERADGLGAVIILTLYYQRQDQYLEDDGAIREGVVNVVDWIRQQGFRNVILEIANEYGHQGYDHDILRSDAGVAGLIKLAQNRLAWLPVSASYVRTGRTTPKVAAASDLILVHFNGVALGDIPDRIREIRDDYPGVPIVCNEDARTGSGAAAAASAAVGADASYGLMVEERNQHFPFEFRGRADDPAAYDRYRALTD